MLGVLASGETVSIAGSSVFFTLICWMLGLGLFGGVIFALYWPLSRVFYIFASHFDEIFGSWMTTYQLTDRLVDILYMPIDWMASAVTSIWAAVQYFL